MFDNALVKYIHDKKGLRGTLVGIVINNNLYVGWSMYNRTNETRPFTKKTGKKFAISRALIGDLDEKHMPYILAHTDIYDKFIARCERYFKRPAIVAI